MGVPLANVVVSALGMMFTDWRTVVLSGFSHKRHNVPYLNIPLKERSAETGVEESTLARLLPSGDP
jgi:hypothetical protein